MIREPYQLNGQFYCPISVTDSPERAFASNPQQQSTLVIKNDDLFLVTDRLGNILNPPDSRIVTGLFCHDTRFLSRAELQIEGRSPVLLGSNSEGSHSLQIHCTNPPIADQLKPESLGIQRSITLCGGLFEELEIRNYQTYPVEVEISLSFATDFQDVFEVRQYGDGRSRRGQSLQPTCQVDRTCADWDLAFAYQGLDGALMEARLHLTHQRPDCWQGNTAVWRLHLNSQTTHRLGYRLELRTNDRPTSKVPMPPSLPAARRAAHQAMEDWLDHSTRIRTDNSTINAMIERAEQDIYALLQSFDRGEEQGRVLAAGIPWFSTLFGRDSILAAAQTLILNPTIARDTLLTLAYYQGRADRAWQDEDPGKILHELRFGEMARNGEIPHTPYYGTVDATPLWLMLYADYYAWTGDRATRDRLWPNALAAMDWIDRQCQATGYLCYARRAALGISNQGWKDSGDCIVDRAGQLVKGPIALCEVQGYVYAAKIRLSAIAEELGHQALADQWRQAAADLQERFNRDFWLPVDDYCALALDGEGRPVDSITSNPGHCLATGILKPDRAVRVARRLQAPDLASGWGIRTLSSQSPAYNPISYHLGSVWPHDSAITASGLRAIGWVEAALAIGSNLLEMTAMQPDNRPPELFCGFDRQPGQAPIPYPVACSPQAWATGSLFQVLQLMINPVPNAPHQRFDLQQPALPPTINQLSLHNLAIGDARVDVTCVRSNGAIVCQSSLRQGELTVRVLT
jgi:glycogen debranching enzyme